MDCCFAAGCMCKRSPIYGVEGTTVHCVPVSYKTAFVYRNGHRCCCVVVQNVLSHERGYKMPNWAWSAVLLSASLAFQNWRGADVREGRGV